MRKVDLSMYSDEELESIGRTVNMWEWDDRIGKKPWMLDQMERYKKFDNIAYRKKMLQKAFGPSEKQKNPNPSYEYLMEHQMEYRMGSLFRAIWPFTRHDYLKPVFVELARRNIKGFAPWRRHICLETRWQRLRRWLRAFSSIAGAHSKRRIITMRK